MFQSILFLCRAAFQTPFQLRRPDHPVSEVSLGEPARESLTEHFKPRSRNAGGIVAGSLRYLRLESCDH